MLAVFFLVFKYNRELFFSVPEKDHIAIVSAFEFLRFFFVYEPDKFFDGSFFSGAYSFSYYISIRFIECNDEAVTTR